MLHSYDAIILGAGAAGLHCAAMAGQMGARVLLLDHAAKVAEKIRISGGGRCNFTNRDTTPAQFLSDNPHFCRSALARYTPQDFIALLQRHGIGFHEKHRGQLFCDQGSERIIEMLLAECEAGSVERWQPCAVRAVRHGAAGYEVDTDRGSVSAPRLVVATGGLSIPKIGATDFGHRLARQFGHRIVEPRPALVPLTFPAQDWAPFAALAGLSLEVLIDAGSGKKRTRFLEDLLFTHRGLSGPAVLQVSSYWRPGEPITIDLAPGRDLATELKAAKARSKRQLGNELAAQLPQRLADTWVQRQGLDASLPMPQARDRDLEALGASLGGWQLQPDGSEGWRKAEVTAGGVDTRELNQQTMESRLQPGLHFIGEVTDVTGWLGGYNFQWAWASAAACATALAART
ncbi:NAD(P)/FAD-dependent oxidoreductase [Aquincola tertiaricarbonis]|uniref:NAD(P)/FAD-dependent oxidoreductase n=1 Tax=Aquincola tertiaricarbonis TaxID=391953 RepID=A0ABY4SK18_AQUTE|nr:NAD(P)/FAD-dependent oxidoreductase [Aquincola tertiaricarbonis]URI11705.1 NAD(P)/FAD-dependent oxidoreductase [Aquincola tertiaricarbonis]